MNLEADLYLSTACGCLATLRASEPHTKTRRARKLADIEQRIMDLLVTEYESTLTSQAAIDYAANIIRNTEFQLRQDVNCHVNDGSDY